MQARLISRALIDDSRLQFDTRASLSCLQFDAYLRASWHAYRDLIR
jgi:hypothetical protein